MHTAAQLTEEEMASYRASARERVERERVELREREERAWELAREAAALLRDRYQTTRVVVFGSLVHPGCFTPWSDVDVAAWGLQPHHTLCALGDVMDLSVDIRVNLVDIATCRPALLEAIETWGVAL
ncbi:MAG: nucleotidyltransferase family protein [Thermoleophilia bacterium]